MKTLKKNKKSTLILLLLFSGSTIIGQGLQQSHHDFSGAAWSGNEICKPCHTPHNSDLSVINAPLWNHQVTNAVFEVYSSTTLEAVPGQPSGKSKLCLSCHDGTIAIENHSGNTSGTRYVNFSNLSTDLRDDHPISFQYSTTLATTDGELFDPSTTMSGLGGTIEEDMLENGNMECTSCHDVHLSRNTEGCTGCHIIGANGMSTQTVSLWKSNEGSALCFTCHDK